MLTKTKIFSSTFIHPYRGWEDNFIFKRKVFSWNSISRLLKAIFSFPAVLIITASNGDTWGDQNQKKQEQFTVKVPLPKRNGLHNSTKPPEPSIVLSTHPSSTELSQLNKAVTMTRPWATSDPCIWVVTEIVSRTTASLLQSSSLWNSVKKTLTQEHISKSGSLWVRYRSYSWAMLSGIRNRYSMICGRTRASEGQKCEQFLSQTDENQTLIGYICIRLPLFKLDNKLFSSCNTVLTVFRRRLWQWRQRCHLYSLLIF